MNREARRAALNPTYGASSMTEPRRLPPLKEQQRREDDLEKLLHDRRWERDGFGQLKNGGK